MSEHTYRPARRRRKRKPVVPVPGRTYPKRRYHHWRSNEVHLLASKKEYLTNKELAQRQSVSEQSIKNAMHRNSLRRNTSHLGKSPYCPPFPKACRKPSKPTVTELFLQEEHQHGMEAFRRLTEARQLILSNQCELATVKLEQHCPAPVYDLILAKVDPPNKVRDCLFALARWVLRSLERNPNRTIVSDLQYLAVELNKKCNYC
jgi:hypothetical protein